MKSSELKLNAEYLSCVTRDWESNTYTGTGHGGVRRVRVLDTKSGMWHRSSDGRYIRGYGGSYRTTKGILVAVLDAVTGEFKGNDVITAASIRGPWESTWPAVQARKAQELALAQEAREASRASSARVLLALGRIEHRTGMSKGMYRYDDSRALVDVKTLERIADLLDRP